MLLEPKKGPKVGKMSRKSMIAAVAALASLLLASGSSSAFAGTPLLSGYGGPGAGEQAIVGSTLLGRAGGGGGSGGSAKASGSASGEASSSAVVGSSLSNGSVPTSRASGQTPSGRARPEATNKSGSKGKVHTKGLAGGTGVSPIHASGGGLASTVVSYPASTASAGSSAIGISSGDVLALIGVVLVLVLTGALTVRLARLQARR